MTGIRSIAGALVCWGVLALPSLGQETLSDPPDSTRQEISQLRTLVAELIKRIDSLEKQVARLKPEIDLKTAVRPGRDPAEVNDGAKPVVIFNGLYKGMMFDATKPFGIYNGLHKGMMFDVAKPVGTFNGVDEGMMIDAIEHRMRWRARLHAR
jgi:hypothetical protein